MATRSSLGGVHRRHGRRASGIGMLLGRRRRRRPRPAGRSAFAGDVAATADSPSWLAPHPTLDVVYAALEGSGAVQAFRRTGEASFVAARRRRVPAGEATCHVAVAPDGGSLVASCWGDGRVVRMTLDAAGRPSSPVIGAAAADPYGPGGPAARCRCARRRHRPRRGGARAARGRRRGVRPPRARPTTRIRETPRTDGIRGSAPRAPTRRCSSPADSIATTDMGLDLVRFWRATAPGLRAGPAGRAADGHAVRATWCWHPSGHLYVVDRAVVRGVRARARRGGRVAARRRHAARRGHAARRHRRRARAVARRRVPLRGRARKQHDRDPAGARRGRVARARRARRGGRGLAASPRRRARHLLVAGQRSDEVASLTLDTRTGVPGRVRHRTEAPSPTCLLPLRERRSLDLRVLPVESRPV